MLVSISSDQSGSYSCQALVNSTSPFLMASGMTIGTIMITVGKMRLIVVHAVSMHTTCTGSFVYIAHTVIEQIG